VGMVSCVILFGEIGFGGEVRANTPMPPRNSWALGGLFRARARYACALCVNTRAGSYFLGPEPYPFFTIDAYKLYTASALY